MRIRLFALTLTAIFSVLVPTGASACSCMPMYQSTTAKDMSEGYVAAIGLAVRQTLVRTPEYGIRTATTYTILDPLGGPLSGEIMVYDFDAFSSCSDAAQIGTVVPLSITQEDGLYTSPACNPVSAEIVAEFQSTGVDFPLWGYDDCLIKSSDGSSSREISKVTECRLFQRDSDTKSAFARKIEQSVEIAKRDFGVDAITRLDDSVSKFDLSNFLTTIDITADAFAFYGREIRVELRADGLTNVTYWVVNDFGQFLPNTLTLTEPLGYIGFHGDNVIIASRDRPHEHYLSRYEDRSLALAIADGVINGKVWPIELDDDCYNDCMPDQFDGLAIENQLYAMTKNESSLELAMQHLESLVE